MNATVQKCINILTLALLLGACMRGSFSIHRGGGAASKVGMAGCLDPDLNKVPAGTSMTLCNGAEAEGLFGASVCTKDGQQDCIASAKFPAADPSNVDVNDVRKGKTIAGVAGARRNCRNGMVSSIYNYDGSPDLIGNTAVTTGVAGDWWDTVDNASVGASALSSPAAWSDDHYCDGSHLVDVTSTKSWLVPSNTPIYCATSGTATCTDADLLKFDTIYYDPYNNFYFTNPLIRRGGAASAGTEWHEAIIACSQLQSGDGVGKWRLPTQKELMLLHMSGVAVPAASKFRLANHELFWVATAYLPGAASAWWVNLLSGRAYGSNRTGNRYAVMCVR